MNQQFIHDQIEVQKEMRAEIDQQKEVIKELQAEVDRLKSEPARTAQQVLSQLRADAENRSNENPPTDDLGCEFDAIWMSDLNDLIDQSISGASK